MTHLTEEQLVLHYYGEEPDAAAHLHLCPVCRTGLEDISRVLDAVSNFPVPEPHPSFESRIFHNLPRKHRTTGTLVAALSFGLAALLTLAFYLGRISHSPGTTTPQGRERILLVALGDHLQRSQMVLVELENANPAAPANLRLTQERARNLVTENRLYRQTATLAGDTEFTSLLDDLERILTDVANTASPDLTQIQQRIESRGLIFQIRVIDSNLHQKGTEKL